MIPAGTNVTVFTKNKRAIGGTLECDYTHGRNATITRPANIDWSGFGKEPTGNVTLSIPAKNIRDIRAW